MGQSNNPFLNTPRRNLPDIDTNWRGGPNFAGVVLGETNRTMFEPLIAPKQRQGRDWLEDHNLQKRKVKTCKKLLVGDSILKHLCRAATTKEDSWSGVINAGLSGDKVENVLWRVNDFDESDTVEKVLVGVGTNNLIEDKPLEVANTLSKIHSVLRNKFPNAEIGILSILPRLFLNEESERKISQINKELRRCEN